MTKTGTGIVWILLMVFAVVLFVLAAFIQPPDPNPWRGRLVCIGLACLAGAELVARIPA